MNKQEKRWLNSKVYTLENIQSILEAKGETSCAYWIAHFIEEIEEKCSPKSDKNNNSIYEKWIEGR